MNMTMTSREIVFRCLEFRTPVRAPRSLWCVPYIPQFRKAELEQMEKEFPDDVLFPAYGIPSDERYKPQGPVPNSYVDDWGCVWLMAQPGVTGEVKEPMFADWSAMAG
jgi:hypothetical protein